MAKRTTRVWLLVPGEIFTLECDGVRYARLQRSNQDELSEQVPVLRLDTFTVVLVASDCPVINTGDVLDPGPCELCGGPAQEEA